MQSATTTTEFEPAGRLDPSSPVTSLKGVGPGVAAKFGAARVASIGDLLVFFPRRLDEVVDAPAPTDDLLGRLVRLRGQVVRTTRGWLPGRRSIVTVVLEAAGGVRFRVVFFNQPYLQKAYPVGLAKTFEGTLDKAGGSFKLNGPRALSVGHVPSGTCVMRYPEIAGISEQRLRAWIEQALEAVDRAVFLRGFRLPKSLCGESVAPDFDAVRAMHLPQDAAEHESARHEFALFEAVELFRGVEAVRRRRAVRPAPCANSAVTPEHARRIDGILPFCYTTDQQRAVEVLRRGIAADRPFGALLHGDVGTGKTAVVLDAAVAAIDSGYQVALLAPTEVLAEQHVAQVRAWLEPAGIRCVSLLGSLPAAERRLVDQQVASGEAQLVVGTHALLSRSTRFARLGLVLVDEQHRFGVAQRSELVAKGLGGDGTTPHVVVMSATPIPRTLTLARFGDLETIVLRDRPPGRRMPPAVFVERGDWSRVVRAICRHVTRGGGVYVVCPAVGEDGELGGAVRVHEELRQQLAVDSTTIGLVHGRQQPALRQATIDGFRRGDLRVLVGTTVLEVGVDVAVATLMVVVGADRFGIATLHQLRGRVGRGDRRGVCILTGSSNARIAAVCATTDGFDLAETDLRMRGAGELLGSRQSGVVDFRALDPLADYELLRRAREAVRAEGKSP